MNLNLLLFNITYYFITFLLYQQTQEDPSTSLGIAFFTAFFWIVAGILLLVLYNKQVIKIETIPDRIGMFTATPILTFILVQIIANK